MYLNFAGANNVEHAGEIYRRFDFDYCSKVFSLIHICIELDNNKIMIWNALPSF